MITSDINENTDSSIHFFLPLVDVHRCKMEKLIQDERPASKTHADLFFFLCSCSVHCFLEQ